MGYFDQFVDPAGGGEKEELSEEEYFRQFTLPSTPGGVGGSPGTGAPPAPPAPVGPLAGQEDVYLAQVAEGAAEVAAAKEKGSRVRAMPFMEQVRMGIEGYSDSAERAVQYPFADDAEKARLREEGTEAQRADTRMPAAYQIGRELPPWLTPGSGAKKLPLQMAESVLTSLGLDMLDFDKQPTTGSMAGNAAGAAAAPLAFRALSRMSPVGVPGSIQADIAGNPARSSHLKVLKDSGYKLTPAEVSGSDNLRRAERQALKNRRRGPGVAEQFNKLTEHNQRVSNRIVADALELPPMLTSLPEDALADAHSRIKTQLDEVVDDTTLAFDNQFNLDVNRLRDTYSSPVMKKLMKSSPDVAGVIKKWTKGAPINARMTGKDWQIAGESLRKEAKDAFGSDKTHLGNTYLAIADSLEEMMARQIGPGRLDRYKKLKQQYAISEMVAGGEYRKMVDVDGNIDPTKVAAALEKKKEVRKMLNRGGDYSPLDPIRTYSMVGQNKKVMPLEGSSGLLEDVINIVPKTGGGTIPAWMYLKAGARLPQSAARSASAGKLGAYLGGRAGGTEMESSIWNALAGTPEGGGLDLFPVIGRGASSAVDSVLNMLSGGGKGFYGP